MQLFFTTAQFRPEDRYRFGSGLACALVGALLFGAATGDCAGQSPKPTEYEVEAGYLVSFGKFIRSSEPQQIRTSFDICVLGRDSFGSSLDALATNQEIDSLPLHVRHIADVTDSKACAILFISSLEGEHIREDLVILGNSDALTISDASDFLERGGMIQFVLVRHRVRFAVNLDAVNRAHIELSSELLRVAASVTGKPPSGGLQ